KSKQIFIPFPLNSTYEPKFKFSSRVILNPNSSRNRNLFIIIFVLGYDDFIINLQIFLWFPYYKKLPFHLILALYLSHKLCILALSTLETRPRGFLIRAPSQLW